MSGAGSDVMIEVFRISSFQEGRGLSNHPEQAACRGRAAAGGWEGTDSSRLVLLGPQ